jgi:hypothetical protein
MKNILLLVMLGFTLEAKADALSTLISMSNGTNSLCHIPTVYGVPFKNPLCNIGTVDRYQSEYSRIRWNESTAFKDYCIDITDEDWRIYPGFQAIKCGRYLFDFSPADYVVNVMKLPKPVGFRFNWRVWLGNKDAQGNILPGSRYGGAGYEGKVIVQ